MKPVCSLLINWSKWGFILLAIGVEANLYITLSIDRGHQLLNSSHGFSALGRHVIIHCLNVKGIIPFLKLKFKALRIQNFNLFQKTFKKSAGRPSIPGIFPFFIFFRQYLVPLFLKPPPILSLEHMIIFNRY